MKVLVTAVFIISMMQVDSQICKVTLNRVSICPRNAEEYLEISKKCSMACITPRSDISYRYHCVRNSNKTKLVEVCAVSKFLFDHCPEYDPVGEIIQIDESTDCNANSKRTYYNSSDMFHCDKACFQLEQNNNVSNATNIPVNDVAKTPDDGSDNEKIWIIVIGSVAPVVFLLALLFLIKRCVRNFQRWLESDFQGVNYQREETPLQ